jgi:GxxExxY protein
MDILVERKVIVEVKAVEAINEVHMAQLLAVADLHEIVRL